MDRSTAPAAAADAPLSVPQILLADNLPRSLRAAPPRAPSSAPVARSRPARRFADLGLGRDDRMRFISQGEHLHTSNERFAARFEELAQRLGAG